MTNRSSMFWSRGPIGESVVVQNLADSNVYVFTFGTNIALFNKNFAISTDTTIYKFSGENFPWFSQLDMC